VWLLMDSEVKLKLELKKQQRLTALEEKIQKTKELRKELESEFNERLVIFLTTAFGVVAALFWQTAITDTIKSFIPVSGAWFYEIFVAFLVTIVAVIGIFFVSKFGSKKNVKL